MEFDNGIPIYSQIVELIKGRIASGELAPGDKLPAVREFALEFGVNPNTMQKALALLEQDGLLFTERTSGRFVSADAELISSLKHKMLANHAARFAENIKALGLTMDEAIAELGRIKEEK